MHEGFGVFLGLDVGKDGHHAVGLSPDGKRLHDAELPNTEARLRALFTKLARHGRIAFGDEIVINQGLELGRPSRLHARVTGSATQLETMEVGGAAVIIGAGEIRLPSLV